MAPLTCFSLLVLWATVVCTAPREKSPVVSTIYGSVVGNRKTDSQGRIYDEFLGMPFAAAPMGDLRWRKSVPPDSWDGVREATEYSPHCVHIVAKGYPVIGMSGETSEDCLYINVAVPFGVDKLQEEKLPVMMYVFGGAYIIGTGAMYPGEELALNGKVIVVTFNYRVGVLGWMTTGDKSSPGNYGLWDTLAALQWVHDNIRNFGGDPNRVTLFGQSAGGAIVSHMMITPYARGLFHHAISVSGGSTGYFGVGDKDRIASMTKSLGMAQLCLSPNSERLVECLRGKDAAVLDVLALGTPVILNKMPPTWFPVIDGDFIPKDPQQSFLEGDANHVDFITGHTHHDGAGFVFVDPLGTGLNFNLAANPDLLHRLAMLFLSVYSDPQACLDAMVETYPDVLSEDLDTRTNATVTLLTDWWFAATPHLEAEYHANSAAEGKRTYVYDFNHRQSFLQYVEPWVSGSHVDDLYSILGEPFMKTYRERLLNNPDFSDEDFTVSHNTMSYFANFAYTGNPNKGPHAVPVEWEQYNAASRRYMRQGPVPEMLTLDAEKEKLYYFWTEEFPGHLAKALQTSPADINTQAVLGRIAEALQSVVH